MQNFMLDVAIIQNEARRSGNSISFKKHKNLFLRCFLAWLALAAVLYFFVKFSVAFILPMIPITVYLYVLNNRELKKKDDALYDNLAHYFESLSYTRAAKNKLIQKMIAHYRSELADQDSSNGVKEQGKVLMVFLTPVIPVLYKIIKIPMTFEELQGYIDYLVGIYLLGTAILMAAYFFAMVLDDLLDYKRRALRELVASLTVASWNYEATAAE